MALRRRHSALYLVGVLLIALVAVSAAGKTEDQQVREAIWQSFVNKLSAASPEQEALLRERAELLGTEYFRGQHSNGDVEADVVRHLQGPLSGLNLTAPTRKCGELVARLSVKDLQFVARAFVNAVLPSGSPLGSFAPVALQFLSGALKYPIQVRKICSSCQQIQSLYQGESFLQDTSIFGFGSYCGKRRFGYSVTTSGLLLLPIDPKTGKVFTKVLRSAVFTRGTTAGSQRAPSGSFPSNITAAFTTSGTEALSLVASLLDIIPVLFGTSAGAVSVMPDNIGYGESYQYPKSYLVYWSYQQASITLWLAARRSLLSTSSLSSRCTALDNAVSVNGYSEGGYSAFSTCLALNQLTVRKSKVRVLRCQIGGTPIDLDYLISFTLLQFKNQSAHPSAPAIAVFLGNAYSSSNPSMVNTNKGQDVLKASYKQVVPRWLDVPSLRTVVGLVSAVGPLNIFSTNVLSLYLGNRTNLKPARSCSTTGLRSTNNNHFCQAVVNNVLVYRLLSATFPTVVCHATDDRLVPFANIPNFTANRNVQFYRPIVPQLAPVGNHQGGNIFCAFGSIIAFANPSNPSDSLQKMVNLTDTSVCKVQG